MAKTCKYCGNMGCYPLCPSCNRNNVGEIPMVLRVQAEKLKDLKKAKDMSPEGLEATRREIIIRSRERENKKELTRMFRNMRKVKMTTTGCPETDRQIYALFGEPDTWVETD